jgi:hypothetical protein
MTGTRSSLDTPTDGAGRHQITYEAPSILDYGDLVEMTADGGVMLHVGIGGGAMAAQITTPITPGGGGGTNLPSAETSPGALPGPESGNAPGTSGNAPAGNVADSGGGPGGGGGGGEGGGGKLPFTGLPAALMGAVGASLTAAGVTVKKALSKNDE